MHKKMRPTVLLFLSAIALMATVVVEAAAEDGDLQVKILGKGQREGKLELKATVDPKLFPLSGNATLAVTIHSGPEGVISGRTVQYQVKGSTLQTEGIFVRHETDAVQFGLTLEVKDKRGSPRRFVLEGSRPQDRIEPLALTAQETVLGEPVVLIPCWPVLPEDTLSITVKGISSKVYPKSLQAILQFSMNGPDGALIGGQVSCKIDVNTLVARYKFHRDANEALEVSRLALWMKDKNNVFHPARMEERFTIASQSAGEIGKDLVYGISQGRKECADTLTLSVPLHDLIISTESLLSVRPSYGEDFREILQSDTMSYRILDNKLDVRFPLKSYREKESEHSLSLRVRQGSFEYIFGVQNIIIPESKLSWWKRALRFVESLWRHAFLFVQDQWLLLILVLAMIVFLDLLASSLGLYENPLALQLVMGAVTTVKAASSVAKCVVVLSAKRKKPQIIQPKTMEIEVGKDRIKQAKIECLTLGRTTLLIECKEAMPEGQSESPVEVSCGLDPKNLRRLPDGEKPEVSVPRKVLLGFLPIPRMSALVLEFRMPTDIPSDSQRPINVIISWKRGEREIQVGEIPFILTLREAKPIPLEEEKKGKKEPTPSEETKKADLAADQFNTLLSDVKEIRNWFDKLAWIGSSKEIEVLAGRLGATALMSSVEDAMLAAVNHWWEEGGTDDRQLKTYLNELGLDAQFYAIEDVTARLKSAGAAPYHFEPSKDWRTEGGWLWYQKQGSREVLALPVRRAFFGEKVMVLVQQMFEGVGKTARGIDLGRAYRPCKLQGLPNRQGMYELVSRGRLTLKGQSPPASWPEPPDYNEMQTKTTPRTLLSLVTWLFEVIAARAASKADLRRFESDFGERLTKIKATVDSLGQMDLRRSEPNLAKYFSEIEEIKRTLQKSHESIPSTTDRAAQGDATDKLLKGQAEIGERLGRLLESIGNLEEKLSGLERRQEMLGGRDRVKEPAQPRPAFRTAGTAPPLERMGTHMPWQKAAPSAPQEAPAETRERKEEDAVIHGTEVQGELQRQAEKFFAELPTACEKVRRILGEREAAVELEPEEYIRRLEGFRDVLTNVIGSRWPFTVRIVHLKLEGDDFAIHSTERSPDRQPAVICKQCGGDVPFQLLLLIETGTDDTWALLPPGYFPRDKYARGYKMLIENIPDRAMRISSVVRPAILEKKSENLFAVRSKMRLEFSQPGTPPAERATSNDQKSGLS